MLKNLKIIIFTILGIFIGFYACIFFKKHTFLTISNSISIEIDPLEILSLLITILLAIYVARILSKQNDSEKNEKDLLIQYFSDFRIQLSSKISKILEQEAFESIGTASEMKIIRKKLDSIVGLAVQYKFIKLNDNTSVELQSKARDLWELLTNTPKKAASNANATVKDGIARLRLEQINKAETTLIEIEKLLFDLTIKINSK